MTPDLLSSAQLALKILTLVGLFVYILFSFIIVRQEGLMRNVHEESSEPLIRLAVYLHLACSIGLFLLAFMTLP